MGHLLKWENKRLNSKSQLSRSHNDTYSVVEKCIGWFFCFVCLRFHLRFKNRLPIWNVFLIIKIESNIKYSVLKAEAWRVWYILTINSVAVSLKLVCKKMRRLKYPSQSWRIRKKNENENRWKLEHELQSSTAQMQEVITNSRLATCILHLNCWLVRCTFTLIIQRCCRHATC